ncbi:hypothetical protein AS9A_3926 [Hoyosella subflava DQS3-9A1]|uniref:Uncharacterized protein n=1 Tax=Hoyosella subflava (strain DSM 45089 / JCM 17490 / NBRC 109087 / DQS3-9A1) TaxID=443218 RepID=F6EHJ8_HOYSD|nr:hypothetical protein AS9A_3926 [Hoyosella subflava DQS3-9A1]
MTTVIDTNSSYPVHLDPHRYLPQRRGGAVVFRGGARLS